MPAAFSLSTPGTMAFGSNGASTIASGLLRTTSSTRPSCSAGVSLRGMKCTTWAPSDCAAISLPTRTPRRIGLAGLRVKVAMVSAWAEVPTPRTAMVMTQAVQRPIDARPMTPPSVAVWRRHQTRLPPVRHADEAPATALFVIPVLARNERERAQGRPGPAADFQRRHDQHELVDAGFRQILEEIVLDDVDAVVGDEQHVHREHLELRGARHEDRRTLLERERVGANRGGAGPHQEFRTVDAGSGRVVALVERRIGTEVLAPSGADQNGVAALEVDFLCSGGALEMLRRDLERRRQWRKVAIDEARDVEHHAAGHQPPVGIVRDVEVGADRAGAAADAAWVGCGSVCIDAAEQLSVAADMADGVDARRAVLAAELLNLGRERELAAVAESPARAGVRGIEEHAVGRIDAGNRRILVPHRRQVEHARVGHVADEVFHAARPFVVGKRRRDRANGRKPCCGRREAGKEIAARQRAVVVLIVTAVSHGYPLLHGSPAAATRLQKPCLGGWPLRRALIALELFANTL